MTQGKTTSSNPFSAAISDWNNGRRAAGLQTLRGACQAGDARAAVPLLMLSSDTQAPANAKSRALSALRSATGEAGDANLRRHLAFMLASAYGGPADIERAISMRFQDAAAGDGLAATEIALLGLICGDREWPLAWLEKATATGSGHAIAALLRCSVERGSISESSRARAAALRQIRHPLGEALTVAIAQLPLHQSSGSDPQTPTAADLAAGLTRPPSSPQALCNDPAVTRWPAVMPQAVCDYLAAGAAPLLQPAQIFDPTIGQMRPDPYRQSLTAALHDGAMDLVSWAIKTRMAMMSAGEFKHGEPLAVLVYRPGDSYRAHFDYLVDDKGGPATEDLARRGQRRATSLIKLNQEFQGGETHFRRLGLDWTGPRGDGLSFTNVDAAGQGDPRTLHEGRPVTAGTKILASLWLREQA
jgi:prolyl 4-hydroxylase